MFTGIIECLGEVMATDYQPNGNMELVIRVLFVEELALGQSIAHDGVCLTVTKIDLKQKTYNVTAIKETLSRTNLGSLKIGDEVNLERCMQANGRFDGHIVQGHVDIIGVCENVVDKGGSWHYFFKHEIAPDCITVEKGSVCLNGVSLTVVMSEKDNFSVAIIPYTFQNTNFKYIHKGVKVNIEFDIIGKYLLKMHKNLT